MSTILAKQIFTTVTATKIDRHGTLPSMTVSTDMVDRDGDRVFPKGGYFKNFFDNPVLCWGHSHTEIPIGTVTQLSADSTGIRIQWKWLENDPQADRVKNAWEQGIVRAASIGFIAKQSVRNEYGGEDHREWELIEVSLVPVPCNPSAVRMLKSLNLWDDNESDSAIDWAKINQEPEINWSAINHSASHNVEVDVNSEEVKRVLGAVLREELRRYIRSEAEEAINHMSGRLD